MSVVGCHAMRDVGPAVWKPLNVAVREPLRDHPHGNEGRSGFVKPGVEFETAAEEFESEESAAEETGDDHEADELAGAVVNDRAGSAGAGGGW